MSDHFDDARVSLHLLEGVGYDQQEDIEVSRSFDDVDEGVQHSFGDLPALEVFAAYINFEALFANFLLIVFGIALHGNELSD